jgi:glycosyltransferase involved in cell wall biosynthesis
MSDSANLATTRQVERPIRAIYSGYVFESTGYGAAARSYLYSLQRAGIDLTVHNRSAKGLRPVADPLCESLLNRQVEPEFHLCHSEPADILVKQRLLFPLVAITTWESDLLPPLYAETLNQVREVWTPSRYNAEAFRRQLKVPVFHWPHAVRVPPRTLMDTAEIDRECKLEADDFVFLAVATWQERKNLAAVVEAFFRAFPDEPGVKLVIKTAFCFQSAAKAAEQISVRMKNRLSHVEPTKIPQHMRIFQALWPEEKLEALTRRANCYVSLHRGEGWCYPLFDAACAGVPVVATGYSGPMDYLDARYHHLVRHELVRAEHGDDPKSFPFNPEMRWAEPDVAHAAELMRKVYENYAAARRLAEAGAKDLRKQYGFEAVGRMARERLTQLREENKARRSVAVMPSPGSQLRTEGGPMPIKISPPAAMSAD